MLKSRNDVRIGITLGDPCGIGPEVTACALKDFTLNTSANFTIIAPSSVIQSFSWPQGVDFVEVSSAESVSFVAGQWGEDSGRTALRSLQKSIELLKSRKIDALVTAPVSKEAIHRNDGSFQGHTEFLADAFGVKDVGMMFVSQGLKTIIVTRHMPLKDVSVAVTRENVFSTIKLSHEALKNLFGLEHPIIGVCGLNPHAGENGLMGREEIETIIPAIKEAQESGINALGPFPADTLFSRDIGKAHDIIVAMYHDQGLIPVKTLSFKKLVNLTIGLPFIRTSPAHGTAFDIAGKNTADPSSMMEAIRLAVELSSGKRPASL